MQVPFDTDTEARSMQAPPSTYPLSHVPLVHVLASEQAVHVPEARAGQPSSQPSAAEPFVSKKFAEHVSAVHVLASEHAVQVPFDTDTEAQSVQALPPSKAYPLSHVPLVHVLASEQAVHVPEARGRAALFRGSRQPQNRSS